MSMLPVHCCCAPSKRLGWVPVPASAMGKPGHYSFVQTGDRRRLWSNRTGQGDASKAETVVIHTEIALLDAEEGSYYAVKSAHVDVAGWRRVAGFVAEGDV